MEYKGKLYGHLGGKMYFDTGKTADDWDALEKRVAELEAENQALRQPLVSGSLPCHHNFIQKDTYWKSCTHCGMIAPLGQ
jgi:hypothetical protein|nr:hypothetical protein [uncultured Flavobacterium sp.]